MISDLSEIELFLPPGNSQAKYSNLKPEDIVMKLDALMTTSGRNPVIQRRNRSFLHGLTTLLIAAVTVVPAYADDDSDGDGFNDDIDPAPYDSTNYSPINFTSWHGDALNDADSDGTFNFWDETPIIVDNDGDSFYSNIDPNDNDYTNLSPTNGIAWYGSALADNDLDGVPNYWDDTPNGTLIVIDMDSDGLNNTIDPNDYDATNYSNINGQWWYLNALGDNDSDSILNFWDPAPNGGYPDADGDGYTSDVDPNDNDATNYSYDNNNAWYNTALNDIDQDGILNFWDSTPYTNDYDSDGFTWDVDPNDNDASNYSYANGTAWYGNVFGDADNDGIQNYWDAYPNGGPPPNDSDGDGIGDPYDPAPSDFYNYSPHNSMTWPQSGPGVYGDADGDNVYNWWDETPGVPVDSDGDGIADESDPAPSDAQNYSSINFSYWSGLTAIADEDSDGTLNWWDDTPFGS